MAGGLNEHWQNDVCTSYVFLPWKALGLIVARYNGYHRTRSLKCSEQFRILAFAQLTYRERLRDIEVCVAAQTKSYIRWSAYLSRLSRNV